MDAALKQRLIGAAVLVALAVIFLPMLVDGPEPPSGATVVPLDIPVPPERDFETRELPLAPAASSSAAPEAGGADDPNRVVAVQAEDAARVDALPEAPPPAAPAQEQPTSPPEAQAAPPTTVAAPVTSAGSAPAASTPPVARASAGGANFAVNLGSYANAANANALVVSLKAAGLPAYTDVVDLDGKPGTRVRLGPYAQRGEAESARLAATRIRSDLSAAVVGLDGASGAAPAAAKPAIASGFAVQIGALRSESDANLLRNRARGAGFAAYVERVNTDAGPLWRVRVGPELQRANAEKLQAAVAQKLRVEGMIVTHP